MEILAESIHLQSASRLFHARSFIRTVGPFREHGSRTPPRVDRNQVRIVGEQLDLRLWIVAADDSSQQLIYKLLDVPAGHDPDLHSPSIVSTTNSLVISVM